MSAASGMRRALTVVREPIVQFLLLGVLLYGASQLLGRPDESREIIVTAADVAGLEQRYRQQFGAAPAPGQLEWLIERHIRDEVLYREGLALGLGADDEVVRRRIVQKMEFLSEGDGLVAEPTEAELRAFYEANEARYRRPARVSFAHLYFSPDVQGEGSARARAENALAQLQRQPAAEARIDADRFWDRQQLERADAAEIERLFGRGELAARVFELPAGIWSGPLRSGLGWHLVRVTAHEAPRLPALAEIEQELRTDWQDDERAQRKQEALERLLREYRIVREGAAPGASTARTPAVASVDR